MRLIKGTVARATAGTPNARAGVTIIEVMVASIVLVVAVGGLSSAVLSSMRLSQVNEETARAHDAARQMAGTIQAVPFAEIYEEWDLPRIRFAYFFSAAKAHESRGNWMEAIHIYREMSEAIMINGDGVEDADDHYSSAHARALGGMATCIRRHLPEPAQRRPHIGYLHGMFADRRYGIFLKNYRAALSKICRAREDLEYWQDLHNRFMEQGQTAQHYTWHRTEAELMRKEILDRLAAAGSPGQRADRRRGTGKAGAGPAA